MVKTKPSVNGLGTALWQRSTRRETVNFDSGCALFAPALDTVGWHEEGPSAPKASYRIMRWTPRPLLIPD